MVQRFLLYVFVALSSAYLAASVSRRFPPVQLSRTNSQKRYARAEQQVHDLEEEGFAVVIPGVADKSRAELVAKNIKWLKGQGLPFDCWIFVYHSKKDLPLDESDFKPCRIVRHEGFWMGHILALPLNMTRKPWVLHFMDSIEPQANVNLREMSNIMLANGLGLSSLTFDPSPELPWPTKHHAKQYPIMRRQRKRKVGRFVDFIELHFNLFSRKYFSCLQDNIDLDNSLGWGMDRLLASLCGGSAQDPVVNAGRMGVIDKMTMVKLWGKSYASNGDRATKEASMYRKRHPEARKTTDSSFGDLVAPDSGHRSSRSPFKTHSGKS
eukprot:TRINITY_DN863_c0_g2_i1.p1 TRINITY_DN863_c0_g2~~TRINITY_DN863_c0_g2_i1.p1  ORF type:complete len:324 (+),score=12.79 TRINITY_DN863_c0_g2_i1:53-1024(+)